MYINNIGTVCSPKSYATSSLHTASASRCVVVLVTEIGSKLISQLHDTEMGNRVNNTYGLYRM